MGSIEVLNEPIARQSSLITNYYPAAYKAVRAAEAALGVSSANQLHVQFMSKNWNAGNPQANLGSTQSVWFDNHRYLKYDSAVAATQASYLSTSCNDNVGASGEANLVIGEWSLSIANSAQFDSSFEIASGNNNGFYKKWFAAQVMAYEKQAGWIFWSWKSEINDWRWSYLDAVNAGIIPTNLGSVYNIGAC